MSVTFAEVIAGIETAAQVASAVKTIAELTYEAAEAVYSYTKDAITSAETAYGDAESAGSSKLTCVLSAVEAFCGSIGVSWDSLKAKIKAFIEGCISMYNTIVAGIASVKSAVAVDDSTSSDVTASTTAADTATSTTDTTSATGYADPVTA